MLRGDQAREPCTADWRQALTPTRFACRPTRHCRQETVPVFFQFLREITSALTRRFAPADPSSVPEVTRADVGVHGFGVPCPIDRPPCRKFSAMSRMTYRRIFKRDHNDPSTGCAMQSAPFSTMSVPNSWAILLTRYSPCSTARSIRTRSVRRSPTVSSNSQRTRLSAMPIGCYAPWWRASGSTPRAELAATGAQL